MCGLVGFVSKNENHNSNLNILAKMSRSIYHRGPDDFGQYIYKNEIYLAHRRLSILDTSKNGSQPMQSQSGNFVIVFNGEIYNHLKIRNYLKTFKNIQWKSLSDTETLLESFDLIGINETLKIISGMFSIVLLNKEENKLYLMRDRIGEKPLYYGYNNNSFFFGSELKVFKENKYIDLNINSLALSKFFKFGYVPSPLSIYKNIFKLPPGCYLEYHNIFSNFNKFEIKKYWDLNNYKNDYSISNENKITNNIENLIENSVKEQLISDVPLGAFLSSGIDSSLIVSLMKKFKKNKVQTFSIGFNESEYNEAKNSKKIAKYLGTEHNELYIKPSDIFDFIPNLQKIYDEPFADSSQIPTYFVSNFAKKNVTVALSGDGGDELFGGYNRYLNSNKILKLNNSIPNFLKNILIYFLKILTPSQWNKFTFILSKLYLFPNISLGGDKIYKLIDLIKKNNVSDLYDYYISFWNYEDEIFIDKNNNNIINEKLNFYSEEDFINEMMIIDLKSYLPDDILVKVDRASMSNSLETRAPFLQKDLVEYALKIQTKYKFNKNNKIILRRILSKYLPENLYNLPKSGFSIPLDIWIRNDLKDWSHSLINSNHQKNFKIINYKNLKNIFDDHCSNKRNWSNKIWTFLMFQSWVNEFEK